MIGSRSLQNDPEVRGAPGDKNKTADQESRPRRDWRDAKEILHRMNHYFMLPCNCGTRLKVSDDYMEQSVDCPRCQRRHKLPEDLAGTATPACNLGAKDAAHTKNQLKSGKEESAADRFLKSGPTPST